MNVIGDILESVKTGKLDQKFIYISEGAKTYYDNVLYKNSDNILDFIIANTGDTLISMGCGNSSDEAKILHKNPKRYIGIDFSSEMLSLSLANLEFINYTLIREDINNLEYINKISSSLGKRTFLFNGFTFGNLDTSYFQKVIDILTPEDNLIFSVSCDNLKENSELIKEEMSIMKHYKAKMDCYLYPLKLIGINQENIQISFKNYGDYLKFQFYLITQKTYPFIKKRHKIILQEIKIYSLEYFKEIARQNGLKLKYIMDFEYYTMISLSK